MLGAVLLLVGIGSVAVAVSGVRALTMGDWATVASTVAGPWIVAAVIAYVGSVLLDTRVGSRTPDRDD
jgi:hypothetical protein